MVVECANEIVTTIDDNLSMITPLNGYQSSNVQNNTYSRLPSSDDDRSIIIYETML
jgi:hypothetical protein